MKLGERVKELRKQRQMTQKVLAVKMGYARNTVSKIEHGVRELPLDEAVQLAQILGVSLEALAGMPEFHPHIEAVRQAVGQCFVSVQQTKEVIEHATKMITSLKDMMGSDPSLDDNVSPPVIMAPYLVGAMV